MHLHKYMILYIYYIYMGTTLPEADQSPKLQAELRTVAWLIT